MSNLTLNEQKKKHKHRKRGELRLKLLRYLETHPCVGCGETDPIVLDFDHLRDKIDSIAKMVNNVKSWEVILEEIEKCQVLCANCHRRKTAIQLGWWKHLEEHT